MKLKILYVMFGVVLSITLGIIYILYNSAFLNEYVANDFANETIKPVKSNSFIDSLWYKKILSDGNNFFPITNELYIHLELQNVDSKNKRKFYKLNLEKTNLISIYCVKDNIKKLGLKYFLINNNKSSEIILDVNSISTLYNLIEILKKNKINSNFEEIWI